MQMSILVGGGFTFILQSLSKPALQVSCARMPQKREETATHTILRQGGFPLAGWDKR